MRSRLVVAKDMEIVHILLLFCTIIRLVTTKGLEIVHILLPFCTNKKDLDIIETLC